MVAAVKWVEYCFRRVACVICIYVYDALVQEISLLDSDWARPGSERMGAERSNEIVPKDLSRHFGAMIFRVY